MAQTGEASAVNAVVGFPRRSEFDKAERRLVSLGLPYAVLSPDPAFSLVGAPALICDAQGVGAIQNSGGLPITIAGWVDYRAPAAAVPQRQPPRFQEDVFGQAAVMFLGPCMADETRIRLIGRASCRERV